MAAQALCRFPLDQLSGRRTAPTLLRGKSLPASYLKNSDEQTIAGIAALSKAIGNHQLEQLDFTHWGAVAAPRFLGRAALAVALTRFAAEGAWGISPHLIPHRSLHALSGTVSQALKLHGPNYGVGGGADGAAEALMVAGALLADERIPGVWVLLTGFDPELVPADPGNSASTQAGTECVALALALVRPEDCGRPVLTVGAQAPLDSDFDDWPQCSLENIAECLSARESSRRWQLRCGGWAAWEPEDAPVETCL